MQNANKRTQREAKSPKIPPKFAQSNNPPKNNYFDTLYLVHVQLPLVKQGKVDFWLQWLQLQK